MTSEGRRHLRSRHHHPGADTGRDLPPCTVERSHPLTGQAVVFRYRNVDGDGVWTVVFDDTVLGALIRPYSVVQGAPPVYVALPPDVTSLLAGLYTFSWREAVIYLERNRR